MLLRAHAKVNLGLHILRKREDGYHDLETVFHHIALHDRITLTPRPKHISLSCNLPFVPTDDRNLCVRAAKLLFEAAGFRGGVHIDLEKHVPVGSGLGGGSSDAACLLVGLNTLFDLHAPREALRHFAQQLGSDVPFFLGTRCAFATGRGEQLEYFDLDLPYTIVVAVPAVHVSTKWAYMNFVPDPLLSDGSSTRDGNSLKDLWMEGNMERLGLQVRNDFEPVVFPSYPAVRDAKNVLLGHGAVFALMSGSGSAVFGLFRSDEQARYCAADFPDEYTVSVTPPRFRLNA